MDTKKISRKIYSQLKRKGADIGNASVFIIDKILKKEVELLCKETAKNVRHKAVDINTEHQSLMGDPEKTMQKVSRLIMNIQFDEVKPKQ